MGRGLPRGSPLPGFVLLFIQWLVTGFVLNNRRKSVLNV